MSDESDRSATRREESRDAKAHHPQPVPDRPTGTTQRGSVARKTEPDPPFLQQRGRGRVIEDLAPDERAKEPQHVCNSAVEVAEGANRERDVERPILEVERSRLGDGLERLLSGMVRSE